MTSEQLWGLLENTGEALGRRWREHRGPGPSLAWRARGAAAWGGGGGTRHPGLRHYFLPGAWQTPGYRATTSLLLKDLEIPVLKPPLPGGPRGGERCAQRTVRLTQGLRSLRNVLRERGRCRLIPCVGLFARRPLWERVFVPVGSSCLFSSPPHHIC